MSCTLCDRTFRSNYDLKMHMQRHIDNKPLRNKTSEDCKAEDKLLPSKQTDVENKTTIDKKSEDGKSDEAWIPIKARRNLKCEECGKIFRRIHGLRNHLISHREKIDPKFKEARKIHMCDQCPRSFTNRQVLKRHKLVHSTEKNFVCDLCQKGFKTIYELNYHKFTHTDQSKLPFKCDQCFKRFPFITRLKKHKESVHQGIKSHKCTLCDKAFKSHTDLRHHMNWHAGVKFRCTLCPKEFTRKEVLKIHVKFRHRNGGPGNTETPKQFTCDECGKVWVFLYIIYIYYYIA